MSEVHRFNVGEFECLLMKDGGGPRPAAGFLPSAPQAELEALVRRLGFDPNALDFSMNILVFKTASQTVLVDTGLGQSNLPGKLATEGIDPAAIDTVVITHGHFDHIGGILNAARDFAYPKARYVLWKAEWEYWTAGDRFSESDENPAKAVWEFLRDHQDRLHLLEGEEAQILPGVSALLAPGHTIGHMALRFESAGSRYLHIADAAHHTFQTAQTVWSPNFDYDPVQAAKTRHSLFARAAQERCLMSAYHFTFPGLGYVHADGEMFRWQAI